MFPPHSKNLLGFISTGYYCHDIIDMLGGDALTFHRLAFGLVMVWWEGIPE
jgi:hypothetical protein